MFSTTDTGLIFHFAESLNCYTKINNFSIQNDISGSLMETGENPVQCRCCVGGAFFKMSLEIISGKAEKVMMPKSEYRLCAYLICCGPQYKR